MNLDKHQQQVRLFRASTVRKSLSYQVMRFGPADQGHSTTLNFQFARQLVQQYSAGEALVYANSVAKIKTLAQLLRCPVYHHDLRRNIKTAALRHIQTQGSINVATSAFGMGIDIANIQAVLHVDQPRSLAQNLRTVNAEYVRASRLNT